jgi:hypothetical protein
MRCIADMIMAAALAGTVSACALEEELEEGGVETGLEATTELENEASGGEDQEDQEQTFPTENIVVEDDDRGGPVSNWFGQVHITQDDGFTYGGWVDGNGPDTYQAWADCGDDFIATGTPRWAGDRRQSHAYCGFGYIRKGIWLNGY